MIEVDAQNGWPQLYEKNAVEIIFNGHTKLIVSFINFIQETIQIVVRKYISLFRLKVI